MPKKKQTMSDSLAKKQKSRKPAQTKLDPGAARGFTPEGKKKLKGIKKSFFARLKQK
jgi:hypothetical protein